MTTNLLVRSREKLAQNIVQTAVICLQFLAGIHLVMFSVRLGTSAFTLNQSCTPSAQYSSILVAA